MVAGDAAGEQAADLADRPGDADLALGFLVGLLARLQVRLLQLLGAVGGVDLEELPPDALQAVIQPSSGIGTSWESPPIKFSLDMRWWCPYFSA